MDGAQELWYDCEWKQTRLYTLLSYLGLGVPLFVLVVLDSAFGLNSLLSVVGSALLLVLYATLFIGRKGSPVQQFNRGRFVTGECSIMRGQLFLRAGPRLFYEFFKPAKVKIVRRNELIVKGVWWKGAYQIRLKTDEECVSLYKQLTAM